MKEKNTTESAKKVKKGYGTAIRIVALLLVVLILISATNLDFSTLRYMGTEKMEAATYLSDHTSYLNQNRYQRLVSLLTNFSAYDLTMQAADSAISKSDYNKAAVYLERCIAMDEAKDQQFELSMRLGCVYMLNEEPEKAAEEFDKTVALDPKQPDPYLLRAQVRVNTDDLDGALEDCKSYIRCGGRDVDMLTAAVSIAELAEDYDTSVSIIKLLIPMTEDSAVHAGYFAELGRYSYLKGDETQALEYIDRGKSINAASLSGVHYAILGLGEMEAGEFEAAAADFRKAGALAESDNAAYYEQAIICAYYCSDAQLLADIAQEAKNAGQMTAVSWRMVGMTDIAQGNTAEAEYALSACLELDPKAEETLYYRGICRMGLEDYEGAVEDFSASIQREELIVECRYNRGLCRLMLEQYDEAAEDLVFVIEDGSNKELAAEAYSLIEPYIVD